MPFLALSLNNNRYSVRLIAGWTWRVELKRWTMSRSDVGAYENWPIASVAAKIEFIIELLVDRLPLRLSYEELKTRVNRQDGCLDRTADLQSRKVIN